MIHLSHFISAPGQLQSIHLRQPEVDKTNVRQELLRNAKGLGAVAGHSRHVTQFVESLPQNLQLWRLMPPRPRLAFTCPQCGGAGAVTLKTDTKAVGCGGCSGLGWVEK